MLPLDAAARPRALCVFGTAEDRRGLQLGVHGTAAADSASPLNEDPIDLPHNTNAYIPPSVSYSLPRGTPAARSPIRIARLTGLGPIEVSVGGAHCACITRAGRDVMSWGASDRGQLGRGDLMASGIPRSIPALSNRMAWQVACGGQHTLVLLAGENSELYAFGSNWRGQLGLGAGSPRGSADPVRVPWLKDDGNSERDDAIVAIAAGPAVSAAVTRAGRVFAWGDETHGQVGRGKRSAAEHSPTKLVLGAFGSGDVRDRNSVKHGSGVTGSDGDLLSESHPTETSVTNLLPSSVASSQNTKPLGAAYAGPLVTKVVFGETHALALTAQGRVIAWGDNAFGQCGVGEGDGNIPERPLMSTPAEVDIIDLPMGCLQDNVEMPASSAPTPSADPGHSRFSITHGEPLLVSGVLPTELRAPLRSKAVIDVAAGSAHSVCVAADGSVFTFGDGSHGQLGGGTIARSRTFRVPSNITSAFPFLSAASNGGAVERVIGVAAGRRHCLARTQFGRLYSWGSGDKFALGHANDRKSYLTPRLIESLIGGYVLDVQAGGDLSAVIIGPPPANIINNDEFVRPTFTAEMLEELRQQLPVPSITVDSLSLWVGTYNINANPAAVSVAALSDWLLEERQPEGSTAAATGVIPDIYALGFQELVGLDIKSVGKDQLEIEGSQMKKLCEENIEATINRTVNDRAVSYVQIFSKQLVGALLCVYARRELAPLIQNVSGKETRVGVMGKAGNKGGVAVRFDIADSQFCFVTSHLAAGLSKVDKRNKDYSTIASNVYFATTVSKESFADIYAGRTGSGALRQLTIFDHENVFWFGDFNYRIAGISKDRVISMIQDGQLEQLARSDQLTQEREAERCFIGFREGRIAGFAPSYKYDPYTTTYDTSGKQRAPAWCDRVLWRGNSRLVSYRRCELLPSDHRPVRGLFQVDVRKIRYAETPSANLGSTLPEANSGERSWSALPPNSPATASRRRSMQIRTDTSKLLGMDLPQIGHRLTMSAKTDLAAPASAGAVIATAVAKFDYSPSSEKELQLKMGDLVEILRMEQSGWWRARRATGETGWVSSEFLANVAKIENSSTQNSSTTQITTPQHYTQQQLKDQELQQQQQQKQQQQRQEEQQERQDQLLTAELPEQVDVLVPARIETSFMPFGICKQGWLSKRGHVRKNWKLRFFVLERNSLNYYQNLVSGADDQQQPLGSVNMHQVGLRVHTEATMDKKTGVVKHRFRLGSGNPKTELLMEAPSREELMSWTEALESVVALNAAGLLGRHSSII